MVLFGYRALEMKYISINLWFHEKDCQQRRHYLLFIADQ